MYWMHRFSACLILVGVAWLGGCQSPSVSEGKKLGAPRSSVVERLAVDVPEAWGGQVKCSDAAGCRLVAVEHENSMVVLHQLGPGRVARALDKQKVAYHPDSAIWLTDDVVVAAVEASNSLDVYRVVGERLELLEQIEIGLSPRDVIIVGGEEGRFQLLATPYKRKEVAWVDYTLDPKGGRGVWKVRRTTWCEAPWHPVKVPKAPGAPAGGIVVACLDDQRVVLAPIDDLYGTPRVLLQIPGPDRIVSRQARVSPSGRWLYVALEMGGRNVRIDLETGAHQWIEAPTAGAVSVLPLSDDWVVWGHDVFLYLQRLNEQGGVLETRWLDLGGFPTGLQLADVDKDGVDDLIVFNSTLLPKRKAGVEVIYGPLWERARIR